MNNWSRRSITTKALDKSVLAKYTFALFFAARLPDAILLSEFAKLVAQAPGQLERTFADWNSVFLVMGQSRRMKRSTMISCTIQSLPRWVD